MCQFIYAYIALVTFCFVAAVLSVTMLAANRWQSSYNWDQIEPILNLKVIEIGLLLNFIHLFYLFIFFWN